MPAAETPTAVTLRQPEGKQARVLRSEIDQLKSNGISLMPEGLEKNISVAQMSDLLSFLKNWRYLDGRVPVKLPGPVPTPMTSRSCQFSPASASSCSSSGNSRSACPLAIAS